jgi:hypothetical protein
MDMLVRRIMYYHDTIASLHRLRVTAYSSRVEENMWAVNSILVRRMVLLQDMNFVYKMAILGEEAMLESAGGIDEITPACYHVEAITSSRRRNQPLNLYSDGSW